MFASDSFDDFIVSGDDVPQGAIEGGLYLLDIVDAEYNPGRGIHLSLTIAEGVNKGRKVALFIPKSERLIEQTAVNQTNKAIFLLEACTGQKLKAGQKMNAEQLCKAYKGKRVLIQIWRTMTDEGAPNRFWSWFVPLKDNLELRRQEAQAKKKK